MAKTLGTPLTETLHLWQLGTLILEDTHDDCSTNMPDISDCRVAIDMDISHSRLLDPGREDLVHETRGMLLLRQAHGGVLPRLRLMGSRMGERSRIRIRRGQAVCRVLRHVRARQYQPRIRIASASCGAMAE